MRKLLILTLAAGALAVPAANASSTHGRGGGHQNACHGRANVMVVLKGTLANDPNDGDTSFMLTVLHTNRWGRAYKDPALQPVTVNVDTNTRYVKADQQVTLGALALNDQVVAKAKASRCSLLGGTPPTLTIKQVVDQTP